MLKASKQRMVNSITRNNKHDQTRKPFRFTQEHSEWCTLENPFKAKPSMQNKLEFVSVQVIKMTSSGSWSTISFSSFEDDDEPEVDEPSSMET